MNLKNTSRLPDFEVEALVTFARRYVEKVAGAPVRLGEVRVTNTRHAYRGRAWYSGKTLLRIGKPERYPVTARYARYKDADAYEVKDPREGLVMLAAHEFWHHARWQHPHRRTDLHALDGIAGRRTKDMETDCEFVASDALTAYRKERADIDGRIERQAARLEARTAGAEARERAVKAKRSSPEFKLAQVADLQAKWERKAKLAATKLKRLRRRAAALRRAIERRAKDAPAWAGAELPQAATPSSANVPGQDTPAAPNP